MSSIAVSNRGKKDTIGQFQSNSTCSTVNLSIRNLTSWGTAILPRQLTVSITLVASPAFFSNHVLMISRMLMLIRPKEGPIRMPMLKTRWRVLVEKADKMKPAMRMELPRIDTNLSLFSLTSGPTRRVAMLHVARKTEKMLA